MTLLLRDPDAQATAPNAETPPEAAPAARTCPTCHSPLEAEQDWCLQCGEAQSARRALPGRRAAATVMALTTLLVGGAVAASYAALSDDPAPRPDPTQLAQVPSSAVPPASAPAPAPAPAPPAPAASTPAPAATTPAPAAGSGALPPASSKPATPAPAPATGSTGSSSSGSSGTSSSGTSSSGTGTSTSGSSSSGSSGTKSTPRTTTTPAEPPPAAITLADGAATLYDPYKRDLAAGDPAKAVDGNPATSFPVTVADGSTTVGAGLVVDLGKLRGIRELDVTTKTPGFKVELYATDSDELPPDVLDTRWAHIKDIPDVGTAVGSGAKQVITLGSGTTKYRHVLLWFTAPPKDGLTVRVSELKLLG
jgi:hypothetical protein